MKSFGARVVTGGQRYRRGRREAPANGYQVFDDGGLFQQKGSIVGMRVAEARLAS